MDERNIGIIILAAGSSSRMGTSKQLLLVDGQPLLLKTVKAAIASGLKDITVVLGANASQHRKTIDNLSVNVTVNSSWEDGMGSSIKAGVSFLLASNKNIQGLVILVCDQPLLKPDHIIKLIDVQQRTGKSIVASHYANTSGVPAFFGKEFFRELLALADSEGAKKIILRNKAAMTTVVFPQVVIDLDTPDDFRKFTQQHKP